MELIHTALKRYEAYELIEWLNEHHPQKFAEDWDNVGLLVGDDQKEISHVFLALDLILMGWLATGFWTERSRIRSWWIMRTAGK